MVDQPRADVADAPTTGSPIVSVRDVGIRYRVRHRAHGGRHRRWLFGLRKPFWGLRHATFDVQHGEVIGFIGPNGSGKTTLLRAISGVYEPDEGEIRVRGRIGPLLSVTAGVMPRLTGWQNLSLLASLLGVPHRDQGALLPKMAEFSGLGNFLDTEVRTYSAGMRARLGFSAAAFVDPDLLVLDEVLAVGDEDFREKSRRVIEGFLSSGKTVLVASHDLDRLAEMCSRVIRMDKGAVVEIGPPGPVIDRYRAEGVHEVEDRLPFRTRGAGRQAPGL